MFHWETLLEKVKILSFDFDHSIEYQDTSTDNIHITVSVNLSFIQHQRLLT